MTVYPIYMNFSTRIARPSAPHHPAAFGRMLLVGILIAAGGCSSTTQIETSAPKTIDADLSDEQPSSRQALLSITLEQGATSLPEDIERFEFRISEVRLHRTDGEWIRLPSEAHQFALPLRKGARRTVLDARVAPARYDSVGLVFGGLFARFGANAGAPLTATESEPLRLAINLETSLESATALSLQFVPDASLRRGPDCRWFFTPVLLPKISTSETL